MLTNPAVSTINALEKDTIFYILGFCNLDDLLNIRVACKYFFDLVTEFTQAKYPIENKAHFVAATTQAFQELSPGHGNKNVKMYEAMNEGWRLYSLIKVYVKKTKKHKEYPCFLEIYSEKYALFNNTIRGKLKPSSRLIEPEIWCPEINDVWILAHIHHGHRFRLLAYPNYEASFWDQNAQRPTALGREIYQLFQAGYKAKLPRQTTSSSNPFSGKGILLIPPEELSKPPKLQDALCEEKITIDNILQTLQNAAQGTGTGMGMVMPENGLGRRLQCPLCGDTISLRWGKDSWKWKILYSCKNNFCLNSRGLAISDVRRLRKTS